MSVITTFEFSAPYEKYGVLDKDTKNLWILFHGYGQLAKDFVKPFLPLKDKDTCLIVPQGLSKFYLSGSKGVVGASWMTSYERETEITNYLNYINSILSKELMNASEQININLFGFSQGTHTLTRWIVRENIPYNRLIIWGGYFAEDILDEELKSYFNKPGVMVVLGDSDRFIKSDKLLLIQKKIHDIVPEVKLQMYKGRHTINEDVLKTIFY